MSDPYLSLKESDPFFRFMALRKKGEPSPCLQELIPLMREFGLNCDGIFVNTWLPEESLMRFYARATETENSDRIEDVLMNPAAASLMEKSVRKDSIIADDIAEDPVTQEATSALIPEMRSFLMQKLELDGRHVGIICFWSRRKAAFTAENAKLVSSLLIPLSAWSSRAYAAAVANENEKLREALSSKEKTALQALLQNSPGLRPAAELLERVADTDVTVLIEGESGCGKEVAARALVQSSSRRNAPFVVVNCGAIPASLIESELFGYEKGAFTDAKTRHAGFFEQADRGTLFLDEVGELPLLAQVKLLRAIQQKSFSRVGGEHPITVDVRIVAATNRNLASEVRAGRFREDLFYRLSVFPVTLPPLRERPGDILLLSRLFASRFAKKYGLGGTPRILAEAADDALSYAWPGNIRELENAAERAVLKEGLVIRHLVPEGGTAKNPEPAVLNPQPAEPLKSAESAPSALPELDSLTWEEVQKLYFSLLLKRTAGRISGPRGAAKISGLHPNTLRSRLEKLGLLNPPL